MNQSFDWDRGTWAGGVSRDGRAEVVVTSDWAPIRDFAPVILKAPEAIYGDLMPVLRQGDLRITNLECPLTRQDAPVWKSGSVLKGLPEHVEGLTSVPFQVVTLANNHVFDHGVGAFEETIRLLDDHGIQRVGAGRTPDEARRPLIVEVKGITVGIVNFSEGEDLTAAAGGPGVFGWELESVSETVTALKQQVNIVLVICHCGVEYIAFPPVYVARAFQRIAEAGADLVIGHHPHVPQGIQFHRGVPICYSLGNFVFYQATNLHYRKIGYLIRAGLSASGLTGLAVMPYEILDDGLALLRGMKKQRFFGDLKRISLPLEKDDLLTAAWHGFLRHYGIKGFDREVRMLMDTLAEEPLKGAAMFRNRIATMQHNQHWIDVLTRIIEGTIDDTPAWALELTEKWLTETT